VDYESASKRELLQIALYEECDIDYKYQAARELQMRQWQDDFLTDLVRLWGKGLTTYDIAAEIGVPKNVVVSRLQKYGLYGKRVV